MRSVISNKKRRGKNTRKENGKKDETEIGPNMILPETTMKTECRKKIDFKRNEKD